jgi:zinc protease
VNKIFVESAGETPLVWFDITMRGGAAYDPAGIEGLHRHSGLWARRGAGSRDRQHLDEYLDQLGASLEIGVGRDSVTVSGVALTRTIDRVIDAAADILTAPRFDIEEHERLLRETPQLIDEVRDDDAALATRWFDYRCCPGHPYGRTALGTESSLRRITADNAIAAWRRLVHRDNIVIGVAGDIDDKRAHELSQRLLAHVPSGAQVAPLTDTWTRLAGVRTTIVDKPARTQAQIRIGHLTPSYSPAQAPALAIAEATLGGMFSSRLMQEIRVKRGWSYGAGCSFRRSRISHWFETWMATGIEVAVPAVNLTREILRDFADHGPSDDEVDLARAYLVGALPFQRATARQRMQLAVRDSVMELPFNFAAQLSKEIANTSANDVRRACAEFLAPSDVATVIVTTSESITETAGLGHLMRVQPLDY